MPRKTVSPAITLCVIVCRTHHEASSLPTLTYIAEDMLSIVISLWVPEATTAHSALTISAE